MLNTFIFLQIESKIHRNQRPQLTGDWMSTLLSLPCKLQSPTGCTTDYSLAAGRLAGCCQERRTAELVTASETHADKDFEILQHTAHEL